jgi:hypothetical protein
MKFKEYFIYIFSILVIILALIGLVNSICGLFELIK